MEIGVELNLNLFGFYLQFIFIAFLKSLAKIGIFKILHLGQRKSSQGPIYAHIFM